MPQKIKTGWIVNSSCWNNSGANKWFLHCTFIAVNKLYHYNHTLSCHNKTNYFIFYKFQINSIVLKSSTIWCLPNQTNQSIKY